MPDQDPNPPAERNEPDAPQVLLHMPVGVRSLSLAVLAVLAALAALKWASAVLIPLTLGVMLSYAVTPAVNWLERRRVPRHAGAAVVLIALVISGAGTVYSLADDAARVIDSLPLAAQKLRDAVRNQRGQPSALDQVQKAATRIEEAAAPPLATRGVTRVTVEKPRFDIKDYLVVGTLGLAGAVGQLVVVLFLGYFLAAAGNTFRRKLVKIAGPTLTKKKLTVQALDEISEQVQRYLLVQLALSVLVGVTTGLAFWALGVEYAAVWGAAAAVLNLVPYVGSIAVTAGAALVAFLQFGTLNMALVVGGASLLINVIEGNLLMPWLTSKTSSMSPVVIFVGVLFWGWLWGLWGLLLGIPIMMAIKAVCDRVDDLKPVGELLGS